MDKFTFTSAGLNYAAKTTTGNKLVFTKGKFGDGTAPKDTSALKDLVHPIGELRLSSQSINGSQVTIQTQFSNVTGNSILPSFHLKEMGLYAKMQDSNGKDDADCPETLVAYAYVSGDDVGDYISNTPTEFIINWVFNISNTDNVSVNFTLDSYVTQTQYASVNQPGLIKLYSKNGQNRSGLVVANDGQTYVAVKNGLFRDGAGSINVDVAKDTDIKAKTEYKMITAANIGTAVKNVLGDLTEDVMLSDTLTIAYAAGHPSFYHFTPSADKMLDTVTTTFGNAVFGTSHGTYTATVGSSIKLDVVIYVRGGIVYWDEYVNYNTPPDGAINIGTAVCYQANDSSQCEFEYEGSNTSVQMTLRQAIIELASQIQAIKNK